MTQRTRRGAIAAAIITIAALASLSALACGARIESRSTVPAGAQRPRVVLISLDGFRADYVDRGGAVNLRALAARGVRAERMVPSFPSKTFPNHYTIVTGLTPEHHGIVAHGVRDPELGLFRINDTLAVRDARWWGGEPIWVTAEKQGRRAATYFWPGSEAPIGGVMPSWTLAYDHERPNAMRVRRVLEWLALPPDSAPGVVTVYFSDVDDAGHETGPASRTTDAAIATVDTAVGAIMEGIARLGLTDVVNVIVVSDHGMAETSGDRLIRLDDYVDLATVEVVDWNPVASIAPVDGDVERVYRALKDRHPHLQVYRKGEVPARFHFNDNRRIPPIVAIADEGWTITQQRVVRSRGPSAFDRTGTHGYDPELVSMGAVFIAAGPGIGRGRTVPPFRNVHVYSLMTHLLGLRPAPNDGTLDSVRAILR